MKCSLPSQLGGDVQLGQLVLGVLTHAEHVPVELETCVYLFSPGKEVQRAGLYVPQPSAKV